VTFIGADGTRKTKTKVTSTQEGARRKLTEMKGDQDAHRLVVSGRATVREWLDVWLEEFVKPNRAPRTFRSYYEVLDGHLPTRIGTMPLARLAAEDVQRALNHIVEGGHARTADLLRAVLRSAFNKAVRLRRMPSNPVLGTDPIKCVSLETATFTADEGRRFLDASEDDRLGALFMIALSLGLRKGEVIGLKPGDIDLENRVLHVRRSLAWVKLPGEKEEGRWTEREPKRGSTRDLPITETIYRALIRHLARRRGDEAAAKEKWNDSGYLFVSVLGRPLHERNVSEAFHLVCDRAGAPRIRFHDTRHSCGTLLHVQGADPFIIQKVLGHSQLSTTKRYTHVPMEVTKTAVTGLESLFEATRKKPEPLQKADVQPAPPAPPVQRSTSGQREQNVLAGVCNSPVEVAHTR
jgi:integrase